MGQVQPVARAREPDVGEAALLLHLPLIVERPRVREHALLQPGDEDRVELEALGRVHRDQRDRVRVLLVGVLVGDEGGLLEQPVKRVLRIKVGVARDDLAQLEQVGPAILALLRAIEQHLRGRPVSSSTVSSSSGRSSTPMRRRSLSTMRDEAGDRAACARGDGDLVRFGSRERLQRVPDVAAAPAASARTAAIVFSPMPRGGRLMIRS